jgi:hypothetical protein
MQCPQCGHEQTSGEECERCGVIFSRWKPHDAADAHGSSPLEELFRDANVLRLNESPRGTLAMLTGWPIAREFNVADSIGRERATVAQSRMWLSIEFAVFSSPGQQLAMNLQRPFFAFFSEMVVSGARGERIGSAKRRFSMLHKSYDLRDAFGQTFATIASPVMHPWTFPIFDRSGQQRAEIAKKWAGMTEEMVTGAQRFKIDFMNHDWPVAQRAVILATALSIDFDSFETQRNRPSLLGVISES